MLMYVPQPTVALAGKPWENSRLLNFVTQIAGLAGAVEVIFGFFGYHCFRVPELAVDVILVELAETRTRRLIDLRGGASAGGADAWATHIPTPKASTMD